MQDIKISKVTLNIGTGKPGPELEKAERLLNKITGMKPILTKAKRRIPTWGIRPGLNIGCKVTLRKKAAYELLPTLLKAIDNKIPIKKFDPMGNFSFGIKEYLDIPGIKYDAEVGVMGLEVAVTFAKPAYRIKKRASKSSNKVQPTTRDEVIDFMKKNFGTKVEE